MTERKLKLVKTRKGHPRRIRQAHKNRNHIPRLISHTSQLPTPKPVLSEAEGSEIRNPQSAIENPAEAAEAARFRAWTAARAARQAMVSRIMDELLEVDHTPPAA